MHPRVGTTLGDYELSASLGGGPFGHVFLAKHRDRDSACAVKVFHAGRCSAATLRYSAELTAAVASIPDVHAGPIFETFIDGPDPFFVLELDGGESLESLRRRATRIPWPQARDVFARIAASLVAAHRGNLAHGNLKPTNIRVFSGGVRLLDWGLSHNREAVADGATRADLPFAVDYQSPEQLSGAPPSPASDLYALGIVLYEAVTGKRPFEGTPNVVAMHHMRTTPPSPLLAAPDLPAEAVTLLAQLLDKNPARRLSSASELLACLHGQPGTPPSAATLPSSTPRPATPSPTPEAFNEPETEVFRRPISGLTEPAIATQRMPNATKHAAETVVLSAPARPEPMEPGAVTLVLESTQGQFLLDTDPKLAVSHLPHEHTSVVHNPSATVFVKHLPTAIQRPPTAVNPATSPSRPTLRSRLQGPWSLEYKLIALNVVLAGIILVGFIVSLRT